MSAGAERVELDVRALLARHHDKFARLVAQCATKATRMKNVSSEGERDVQSAAWLAVVDPARWKGFDMGDAAEPDDEWRRIGRWFRIVLNHVCEEAARAEDMLVVYQGTRRAASELRVGVRVYSGSSDESDAGTISATAWEAAVHTAMDSHAATSSAPRSKLEAKREAEGLHLSPRAHDPIDVENAELVEILAVMTGGPERVQEIWRIVTQSRCATSRARRECASLRAQIALLDELINAENEGETA